MKDIKLKVPMHCATCAVKIDKHLKKLGVKSVSNAALKIVKVNYDETKISEEEIVKTIKLVGYDASVS